MRIVLSGATALLILAGPSFGMAQPAPQFSVDDLEKSLSGAQATQTPSAASAGNCEAQGMVTGADGSCEPRMAGKRGFSLSAPEPAPTAARPPPSRANTPPPRRVASRPAAPVQQAVIAPAPRGFDLLISFENNSNELTDQAKANAKVFADALQRRQLRKARFAIEGHTDAVGSRGYNQNLSEARAKALVEYLVGEGVDRSRFQVRGYGFSQPLNGGDPKAPENRRVEARRLG